MAKRNLPVHLVVTTFRRGEKTYHNYLLRHTYREDGKVKNKTVANLSHLPLPVIEAIKAALSGSQGSSVNIDNLEVVQSLPHGHVAAIHATARRLGMDTLLSSAPSRERDIILAMLVQRIIEPTSKLASTRLFSTTTLSAVCDLGGLQPGEPYAALDWLYERQKRVETKLAKQHIPDGSLVLYDLSSSWVEGAHCPLAAYGHYRDRKKGVMQIEYGLITNKEGCPVAVEVFAGDTSDPTTVPSQIAKVTKEYGISDVVMVGDRGMLTGTEVDKLKDSKNISWLTAMRHDSVRAFCDDQEQPFLPLHTQEEVVAEYTDEKNYPKERIIICRNAALAKKLGNSRLEVCARLEEKLAALKKRCANPRSRCHTETGITVAADRIFHPRYAGFRRFFTIAIGEGEFSFARDEKALSSQAMYDGIFALRTSVPAEKMDTHTVVTSYKLLTRVERRFRHIKTDLEIRPIHHWKEERVRAHVFLCMMAEYVRWHMEQDLAPMLFVDDTKDLSDTPLHAPAPSQGAREKTSTRHSPDGLPVHSFSTLMSELSTMAKTTLHLQGTPSDATFVRLTTPTPTQTKAFQLLNVTVT